MSSSGITVSHPNANAAGKRLDTIDPTAARAARQSIGAGTRMVVDAPGSDGQIWHYIASPIRAGETADRWDMVVAVPSATLSAAADHARTILIISAILCILASCGALVVLVRRLVGTPARARLVYQRYGKRRLRCGGPGGQAPGRARTRGSGSHPSARQSSSLRRDRGRTEGAATQEIAGNVSHAAAGTSEVMEGIVGVADAAEATGAAASQVLSSASGLSQQSEILTTGVGRFLAVVRAAWRTCLEPCRVP